MDETAQKALESLAEQKNENGDKGKEKGKPGGKKGGVALKTTRSAPEEKSTENPASQESDKEVAYGELSEESAKQEVKTDG